MANNDRCGCNGRRNSNNAYGCLGFVGGRNRWENTPYYTGPCPDANGVYDCEDARGEDCRCRRERRRGGCFGMFSTMLPVAVAANGIVPLVSSSCLGSFSEFPVNSGLVSVEEAGTYLATYTVRLPEGQAVDSTFTLNVNDASQSSAVIQVGGEGPACFTGQALFDAPERSTVTLRSSDAINLSQTSPQPLVTLTLMRVEE